MDSSVLLFLKHNVCFRETDPLTGLSYLVFPELINLKKPAIADAYRVEDDVSYTVAGPVQNVYSSLVVLLGYTQTFTRTDQWQSQARYEVGDGLICGFKQESQHEGELELVLYFGTNVGQPVRSIFKGLFESFLTRRNLKVLRYEPAQCCSGHVLNRAVVRERSRSDDGFAFCPTCGEKILISVAQQPIQLTQAERTEIDEQQWFAARRSRFEQAIFKLVSYVETRGLARPSCFISYAWGDKTQEKWIERDLATDLRNAGINVLLDRWDNSRVGSSIARFVEQISKSDCVITVGTPLYLNKYENQTSARGTIVAAEGDVITSRLLGTEAQKQTVVPILLSGDEQSSFPPLLRGRVYADFRDKRTYFSTAFTLITSLYKLPATEPVITGIRDSLKESEDKLTHAF